MSQALIKSDALNWAFERSGFDADAVAAKLAVSEDKVNAWLSGQTSPTFRQAQRLAKLLSIPFGFLFLSHPPEDQVPLPEFRTVGSKRGKLDNNTRDLLQDIQFKRDWFSEYLRIEETDPVAFIGRFSWRDPAQLIAADMRQELQKFDERLFLRSQSHGKFLTGLMSAAEQAGVWVMRSGIVGNNTSRPLDVAAMRGFAISDSLLPIVFINGQDAPAAQIYTLAHELAHLWIGSSDLNAVDISEANPPTQKDTETACNKIAAEFLAPEDEFMKLWSSDYAFIEQVDEIASKLSVSRIVVAKRAADLGLIPHSDYRSFFQDETLRWSKIKRPQGGNFFATIPVRNGKRFTRAVLAEARSGRMLLREASGLLGVKPAKLKNLEVDN